MAILLTAPVLKMIETFDPSRQCLISFTYEDEQIAKKRLLITDNATQKTVYDSTLPGMKLSYLLPAGSLTYGQYTAQIQVFNQAGDASQLSSPSLFYCYYTPALSFRIQSPHLLHSANLKLDLVCSKEEGTDDLGEYYFCLYGTDKELITSSELFYPDIISSYTFYGLKNDQIYYARCYGKTVHGLAADTGYNEVRVSYAPQPANMLFKVLNHTQGYITLDCSIIDIGYEFDNDQYVIQNGELTLKDNRLTYLSGFEVSDHFAIFLKARKLPLGIFFTAPSEEGDVTLSVVETGGDFYCELTVTAALGTYHRYTPLPKAHLLASEGQLIYDTSGRALQMVSMDYQDEYTVVFELKRKGHLYSLKAYYEPDAIVVIP